ncbi:MAG TPA: VWA domain-containing protein [Pyrinomonadaceae bacterium]|nr:VWA domain-containing protein [Pyrinomonadaceae bacterium]
MNRVSFFMIFVVLLLSLTGFTEARRDQGTARPIASPTPPTQTDEDVIRTKTNLVQLDVVAVDNKGRQVTGLTAGDFKIIDNGRERVPEFVTYVSLARSPANPISGHPSAEQLGRVFVFVVSNPVINFAFSAPGSAGGPRSATVSNLLAAVRAADSAQSLLSWFVNTQMTNADLAAIASTEVDLGVLSSFTNDRDVLDAAMKRTREAVRQQSAISITAVGRELQSQSLVKLNLRVMETLENVIAQVEMLPGRKVVTLLSGGLLYHPQLPYHQVISERLERLIKKANQAQIAIYTLHTRDLDLRGRFRGNDALIRLAEQTGGQAISATNDLRVEFENVIEENRGYYLLSYNPGADVNQRPSNLQVRVSREGVKVLSRVEGLAQKAVTAKSRLAVNPFASPLSANEIGLSLSPEMTKLGQVVTSCRLDLSNVEARAREDGRQDFSLKLSIRVTGPDGRDFKQADRDLTFNVSGAELETARRDGVLSTFEFEGAKPGFYRISVAVRDNYSGKLGNSRVFYEVSRKDVNKSRG